MDLPEGARASRKYCDGACRTAAHRRGEPPAPTADRPKPPPRAWIVLALDLHRAAPAQAVAYRLVNSGKGWQQTFPAVGAWWLDPFQPPDVPREGRYAVRWVDAQGHEFDGPELSFWLSV